MNTLMTETDLLKTYNKLPEEYKQKITDYLQFIIFEYNKNNENSEHTLLTNTSKKRKLGIWERGTFYMSPDFNEPIEDLADYI